ncbi:MAG TPA: hypothetical protein VGJ54_07395 [Streptosporangiaceae bacterium]
MRPGQLRRVAAESAAMLRAMRTATPPSGRVTGIWCRYCRRWLKPSKFTGSCTACTSCTAVLAAQARRSRKAG